MSDSQPLPLSVFDFDGTLSYRDSFVPFLLFCFGPLGSLRRLLPLLPHLSLYLLGASDRNRLKGELIKAFLTGIDEQWLSAAAERYAEARWQQMMRPAGLRQVESELQQGRTVTLCSASPRLMLEPFARRLGVGLIATELVVESGRLSGALRGENCRRQEKVRRLEERYGPRSGWHMRAWGDSAGDRELLASADEGHYRPFRQRQQQPV
jgi:phosphatidylglycerophosphatase C